MSLLPIEILKAELPVTRPKIALSEGADPRVVAGAFAAHNAQIADIILVGDKAKIEAELKQQNIKTGSGIEIHDPAHSKLTPKLAQAFYEHRKHKGISEAAARDALQAPLCYAAMLVREGHAAGTVGGAVHTTSDVVRTALQVIGKSKNAEIVSSFFLMYPPKNSTPTARAMLYSDCGLIIDPNAQELAAIAAQSANSAQSLLRTTPKIALLSFSTKGSAKHEHVNKITDALEILQREAPNLEVDGELQFDAAFVPEIGHSKAPNSKVAGHANVMIFPDLDAGNIGYKITQRIGGYSAIGPILQGLQKPANDLSRGCSAEDVTQMIAVTVLQSQAS